MRRGRRAAAAATAALLFLTAAACSDDEDTAVENAEEAGEGDLLIGETVAIEGEVQNVFGDSVFTIGRGRTIVFGAEPWNVSEGDEVTVVGEVVEFLVADVESSVGLDPSDERLGQYENELAIEATDVVLTDD